MKNLPKGKIIFCLISFALFFVILVILPLLIFSPREVKGQSATGCWSKDGTTCDTAGECKYNTSVLLATCYTGDGNCAASPSCPTDTKACYTFSGSCDLINGNGNCYATGAAKTGSRYSDCVRGTDCGSCSTASTYSCGSQGELTCYGACGCSFNSTGGTCSNTYSPMKCMYANPGNCSSCPGCSCCDAYGSCTGGLSHACSYYSGTPGDSSTCLACGCAWTASGGTCIGGTYTCPGKLQPQCTSGCGCSWNSAYNWTATPSVTVYEAGTQCTWLSAPALDFSISNPVPGTVTVVAGGTTPTIGVTVTLSSLPQTVNLTCSTPGNGITCNFSGSSCSAASCSLGLIIGTSPTTPIGGPYTITISGINGQGKSHSSPNPFYLIVGKFDYSLGGSDISFCRGSQESRYISVTKTSDSTITLPVQFLGVSGLGPTGGATPSFGSPPSCVPDPTCGVTLTISAPSSANPDQIPQFPINVDTQGGLQNHSLPLTLNIRHVKFWIVFSSHFYGCPGQPIWASFTNHIIVTDCPAGEIFNLTADPQPGVTIKFNPESGPDPFMFWMEVNSAPLPIGKYGSWITATATTGEQDVLFYWFEVKNDSFTDFNLSVNGPSGSSVCLGGGTSATISVRTNGCSEGFVRLSASADPRITVSLSPQSDTAPFGSIMNITTPPSLLPGTYPITIIGTAPDLGITRTITYNLTVASNFDYNLLLSSSNGKVHRGSSISTNLQVPFVGCSSIPVTLSVDSLTLPTGVTATFSPDNITTPGTADDNATLKFTTSQSTPIGTYPITIKAIGGGIPKTSTYNLTVCAADFTISASPTSKPVNPGGSATTRITTGLVGTFGDPVTLSVDSLTLPTGVTATFSPDNITTPGTGDNYADLTFQTSVGTPTPIGSYPITINGTVAGVCSPNPTTFTLIVATTGAFNISISPPSGTVDAGSSVSPAPTISIGLVNPTTDPAQTISYSVSAPTVPPGSISFSLNPLPPCTAGLTNCPVITLGISTFASTKPDTYPIQIIGDNGAGIIIPSNTYLLTVNPLNQNPKAINLGALTNNASLCCGITYPPVRLSWTYSDDDNVAGNDPQSAYRVEITTAADPSTVIIRSCDPGLSNPNAKCLSSSTEFTPPVGSPTLSWNTDYLWRVIVWDTEGPAESSPVVGTFKTISHPFPVADFDWYSSASTKQFCAVAETKIVDVTPCALGPGMCGTTTATVCSDTKGDPVNPFKNRSYCYKGVGIGDRDYCNVSGYGGTFLWEINPPTDGTFEAGTAADFPNPQITISGTSVKLGVTDSSGYGPCYKTKSVSGVLPLPKWKEVAP